MYTKKDENEKCERWARKKSADMIGQKQQTSFNYERSNLESKVDKQYMDILREWATEQIRLCSLTTARVVRAMYPSTCPNSKNSITGTEATTNYVERR